MKMIINTILFNIAMNKYLITNKIIIYAICIQVTLFYGTY